MKKFILPVIGLIALILVGITFGLGANSAVYFVEETLGRGNWYQLVWTIKGVSVIGCVGFFLLCVGSFFGLIALVPFKFSKFLMALVGLMFIGAGVMFLLTPGSVYSGINANLYHKTSSYIAMIVLVFVAGGLDLLGACVGFLPEKK